MSRTPQMMLRPVVPIITQTVTTVACSIIPHKPSQVYSTISQISAIPLASNPLLFSSQTSGILPVSTAVVYQPITNYKLSDQTTATSSLKITENVANIMTMLPSKKASNQTYKKARLALKAAAQQPCMHTESCSPDASLTSLGKPISRRARIMQNRAKVSALVLSQQSGYLPPSTQNMAFQHVYPSAEITPPILAPHNIQPQSKTFHKQKHALSYTTSSQSACQSSHLTSIYPSREWCSLPVTSTTTTSGAQEFTVMSYNVLCDEFVDSKVYHYCAPWALDANYRRGLALTEILAHKPDVICLQEVDHFLDFWSLKMAAVGYAGFYKRRTGTQTDGVATFYRTDKFKLLKHESLEYRQFPHPDAKDNVALLCLLETLDIHPTSTSNESMAVSATAVVARPKSLLCVANTHILYNDKRGDLKLGQLQMLLNRIPLFSLAVQEANQSAPKMDDLSVGVVICGDFNASISSQLFQFMMQRKIDLGPLDRRQMDGLHSNKHPNIWLASSARGSDDFEEEIFQPPTQLSTMELDTFCQTLPFSLLSSMSPLTMVSQRAHVQAMFNGHCNKSDTKIDLAETTLNQAAAAATSSVFVTPIKPTMGASSSRGNVNSNSADTTLQMHRTVFAFHPLDNGARVHHPLRLSSVYEEFTAVPLSESDIPQPTGQRRISQYHGTHQLMVDACLYEAKRLRVTGYYELPKLDQMTRRLPNTDAPSDHLCLLTRFAWQ